MKNHQITISKGNAKLGQIPSVSLPSCTTCNPSAPCFKDCYARRIERIRKQARESYAHNLEVLNTAPESYWLQIMAAACTSRYFRYHVAGDIPNVQYLANMERVALNMPGTRFLAFTKQYKIVNDYIECNGPLPSNLIIIFSNWGTWKCENPHNLPQCEVIFKGQEPEDDWKICGGNCTECACRGVGCWELKQGETIAIYKH